MVIQTTPHLRLFLIAFVDAVLSVISSEEVEWLQGTEPTAAQSSCSFERLSEDLSSSEFEEIYLGKKPVVLFPALRNKVT